MLGIVVDFPEVSWVVSLSARFLLCAQGTVKPTFYGGGRVFAWRRADGSVLFALKGRKERTGNTDPCPKTIRVRFDPINAWKDVILRGRGAGVGWGEHCYLQWKLHNIITGCSRTHPSTSPSIQSLLLYHPSHPPTVEQLPVTLRHMFILGRKLLFFFFFSPPCPSSTNNEF